MPHIHARYCEEEDFSHIAVDITHLTMRDAMTVFSALAKTGGWSAADITGISGKVTSSDGDLTLRFNTVDAAKDFVNRVKSIVPAINALREEVQTAGETFLKVTSAQRQ